MNSYLAHVRRENQTVNPVLRLLHITVDHADSGTARLTLHADTSTAQGAGMLSGGVLSTLLDEAMAHAVLSCLHDGQRTATVDLHVQFLSGARPGDTITAEAQVVKNGSSIAFVQAEARAKTTLVATASASFHLSRAPRG